MTYLPTEILLLIVDGVVNKSDKNLVYAANDPITTTLFNLALTCRALRLRATQLLYSRCLHIDSDWRLNCLMRTLSDESLDIGAKNSILAKATSNPTLGLFLAPFPGDDLDQPEIVKQIIELFDIFAPYLTQLAIDMPLRSMWAEEDHHNIRPSLRRAFEGLSELEQFSSIRDELFLRLEPSGRSERQPLVWAMCWPKLRRLSLYNPDISSENFLRALWSCPGLENVVLTRSDGLVDPAPDPFLRPESESYVSALPGPSKKLEMKFINNAEGNNYYRRDYHDCAIDPTSDERRAIDVIRLKVTERFKPRYYQFPAVVTVPQYHQQAYADEIEMCQEWVKSYVLNGRLWEVTESSAE
ncbi:hypothetical protein PISL3812_08119 [Talaromyces islandicus]|uniref:F-box domain-containing protein n=1 Tax=Talaromyces islandicus TaxID=28573 RepID=A0A0U1M7M7_TALIS|nr:hypothetical protein PISL3812_08119 [Talaromyces islandicus]